MPRAARFAFILLVSSCGSFEAAEPGGADASSGGSSSGSSSASSSGGSSGGGTADVLAAGLTIPRGVVATDGGVYWTSTVPTDSGTEGRLHRCDLAGCTGGSARMVDEQTFQVSADATNVYWTSGDALRACATGPACTPRTLLGGVTLGLVLAAGGMLHFTTTSGTDTALRRCAPDACTSSETLWTGGGVGAVATSGDDVYFTAGQPSKELRRANGSGSTLLGTLPGLPVALATIGPHAYFVSNGVLYHCDASTACTPVPFNTKESSVYTVVTDGGAVYFSVYAAGGAPGSIQRCSAEDCSAPTVLVSSGNPQQFALHAGWLYYADWGDTKAGSGSIRRVRL